MLSDQGRREQFFKDFPAFRKTLEGEREFGDTEIARLKQAILPHEIYERFDPVFRLALCIGEISKRRNWM